MTRRSAAVVVALVALASGCGGGVSPSAGEQVPALATGLARVDAALAAHEFAAARKELRKLRTEVVQARSSDELSPSDATRVLDAIAGLLATMPVVSSGSTSAPVPTTSVSSPGSRPSHAPTRATETPTSTPTPLEPTPSSSPTTGSPSPTPTPSETGDSSPSAAAASPTP